MKLSEQCIEAIDVFAEAYIELSDEVKNDQCSWKVIDHSFKWGAEIALTNPSIYSKAGLISLEDAFGFAEWVDYECYRIDGLWIYECKPYDSTNDLFQIYQEQKEK